jgi:CotH kinase protein/Bacterial Ig-like domain (group 3)
MQFHPGFRKCLGAAGFLLVASGCWAQAPALSVNPSALTIYPGQQNVPLTIKVSGSNPGPVAITLSGLPSGITVSPLKVTPGNAGTLMLSASLSAGQEGFSNQNLSIPTSWTARVTVYGNAASAGMATTFSLTISISNPSFTPAASAINLPIVNINTSGVPIVSKTTDVTGTITITSADAQTSYLPNASDSDNTATFHVHGNSTSLMPKLPYHVKLNTSLDLLNTMGLTCPYVTDTKAKPTCDKSKSFILLANYDDKTLLRTWAAATLANAIPMGSGFLTSPPGSPSPSGTGALMPWAPHSLFVELFLNGVYEGNYQLTEEVKVDSHRVNIDELAETDTAPAQVTGGYLLDIDVNPNLDAYVFNTPKGLPVEMVDPDYSPDPEVPEQTSYISNYVGAAETALFSDSFTDPVQGWRAYFDEAAAVNFYLVNEVMGNGDIFINSNYLYKNDNNPLLYMGPVWDFDVSSGNANYVPIVNPTVPWARTQGFWFGRMFADPGFAADAVLQWNALKSNGVFTGWLASIRQMASSLEQSQANNFGRWPMQGIEVWPNAEAAGSYDGEVAYLMNWLTLRMAYLDSLFNNKAPTLITLDANVPQHTGRTPDRPLPNGAALTLTAHVSGGVTPTGVVSFLSNGVLIGTGSLDGSGAATVTVSGLGGMDELQAVYNGDAGNALSTSAIRQVNVAEWSPTLPPR